MTRHTINLTDEQATLSPEWLRQVAAKPNAVILVAEPKLSMLADAIEIADSCARSDIESFCGHVDDLGVELMRLVLDKHDRWYDTTDQPSCPFTEYEKNAVTQAVRYLDARGILSRHADKAHLVRFPLEQPK